MKSNNILEMTKIDKIFPGVKALDQVDFSVKRGEVHCLIGANGAGKSTLMKILSGAYQQDSGIISFDGKQLDWHGTESRRKEGISVIYQELSLFGELTVGENVYVNNYPKKNGMIDWKKVYEDTQKLADNLNIRIDAKSKISDLNIGQRQLTEIMKSIACNAKLIVMDEPSSTLSKSEFQILMNVIQDLKEQGITIIYISHHLEELFQVGDRITVLRDGQFVTCKSVDELNENSLVEYMTGTTLSVTQKEKLQLYEESKETVLELRNVCNPTVSNINMKLHKGEVLGIYGLVGSGRTEILQSIFGVTPVSSGEIYLHGKQVSFQNTKDAIINGIGLAPESRKTQGLVLPLPVWENMSMVALKKFWKHGRLKYKSIYEKCDTYKSRLKIKTPSLNTITGNLSGGNQQKIILAKWLMQDCDILLLDEPTQGIDVAAKSEIYRLINEMTQIGKSMIVVSSELEELLHICDTIHVMYDGAQVIQVNRAEYASDYILHASVTGKAISKITNEKS